jgi:hypothetical protein
MKDGATMLGGLAVFAALSVLGWMWKLGTLAAALYLLHAIFG